MMNEQFNNIEQAAQQLAREHAGKLTPNNYIVTAYQKEIG